MSKFFTDFLDSMEQYNPEAIPEKWHREETFDEDGRLHSFNDLPIKMKIEPEEEIEVSFDEPKEDIYEFRWYNHGSLYRSGNRAPVIRITDTSYSTLNEERNVHSYNDQPANIRTCTPFNQLYYAQWCKNGELRRENDSPANIIYNADGTMAIETYIMHGDGHRGNSLPCEIAPNSKAWMVRGIMHNSEGYAQKYAESVDASKSYSWKLYGVDVTEEAFMEIKTLSEKTNIPIWVSFLLSLEFITQEHLTPFMNSDGKWETKLPASWVLNCWNITESVIAAKNDELEISGKLNHRFPDLERNPVFFTAFTRVLQSEENDALLRATTGEESYV